MAFILKDRVKENTTSTGTSSVTLGGASATFETFQQYLTNGDTTFYAIVHTTSGVDEWEVGLGSWNTGNTLSRTTVLSGSNGTSAVNFSAGNKDVFMTLPADKLLHLDANGDVDINGGTIDGTVIGAAQAAASNFTTVDATGNVSVGGQLDVADWIDLASQASHPAHGEGRLWYDNLHKTLNYYSDDAGVVHELGIEEHARVYNETGSTLSKGTPVHFAGTKTSNGTYVPTVAAANATSSTKYKSEGMVASDIANNSYGYIITAGRLEGIDTSHLSIGQFFTGITDGATQTAAPVYPNFPMCLGFVVRSDATNGVVFLAQQNHSIKSFRVQMDQHIGGSLTIDGDLNVTGSTNTTSTSDVTAGAPFYRANEGDAIGDANTTFTGSGLDDAFFAGHFTGTTSTNYYVKIDGVGTPDTFAVSTDNFSTTISTGNAITGSEQMIHSADNISVKFGATTGHTLNDVWTGTASPINVDTGFFSNRNTGTSGVGYTHMGLFYDASESKWRLVDEYDPVPAGTIDTAHSSYVAGTIAANVEGNVTGDITGNVAGNAATASALESARTIGGVSFDGTANINLAGVNTTGNQDTTGNAATATALENARTIQVSGDVTGSASFDGTANINITTTVQDDSHAHVISNVDGLQSALDAKVPTSRTITAGNGLTGGGDLSANRTLTVGGGTGITVNANDIAIDSSYTGFDGRYYTETEADSRFLRGNADDSFSGNLTSADNGWIKFYASEETDSNDGKIGSGVFASGLNIVGAQTSAGAGRQVRIWGDLITASGAFYFSDGYHPNADKWTTARTLTLTGDVTGSVSWDGSANASLAATVANDSHNHDGRYYTETEADSRFVNVTGDTIQTLQIGTNTVGTTSDIALSANVAINAENSLSFGMTDGTSGYYRWMFGNTSKTGGTAGGTEKMRLNKDGNLTLSGTVDGVDIAARDGVLTTTTNTANAALPKAGGTITGALTLGSNPSNAGELRVNDTSTTAYTVAFKGTGTRGYAFEGSASSADYNTTFSNAGTGDHNVTINGHLGIGGTATDSNWGDATHGNTEVSIDGGGGYGVLHFRGDGAGSANTRYSIGAGDSIFYMAYDDVDGVHRVKVDSSHRLIVNEGSGDRRVFHDGYHPNADKWTTARTLTLSGDASGSVSWDGSANATLSVTVANDSHSHSNYITSNADDSLTAAIIVPTANRDEGIFGTYDSNKTQHIWSMGTAYRNAANGSDFGNMYGLSYYHTNNGTNGTMAGSHQTVHCINGSPKVALGTNIWTSGSIIVGGTVDGVDIAARNGVLTTTTNTANAALPKAGGTMTGELQLNARLDVGDGSNADTEIRVYKSDNNVSDHIQFYNGTTRIGEIGCHDTTWLRINQVTAKNIYTPRYIRADGGFFVDDTTKGINGSGNFIGGTITGASDANVSNWDAAYTTANAALPKAGGTMTGDLTIPAKIIHSGDTDTYFEFHGANLARMVIAGAEVQEWGANYTLFSDNDVIRLGSGNDFRMWFDGTHTYFRNYAHAGGNIYFQGEDTEGSNHALLYMHNDGSSPYLRLFQNGEERLRTTSGGVGVTGICVGALSNPHNAGGLQVTNTNDEKIVLSGSTNPYIRWQEGTTDRAYIQWSAGQDALLFRNQQTDNFDFMPDASTGAVNLRLRGSDNDTWGSLYGTDNSGTNQIGILDGDQNWAYRINNDTSHEWLINNTIEMSLSTSTLDMKNNAIDNVNQINIGAEVQLRESTERADLLQITSVTSGWAGLQIRNSSNEGRWSFMTDGSAAGFYDDENNKWSVQMQENGGVTLYHNGVANFTTGATYMEMARHLDLNNYDIYGCDQLFHHGDTNTYMQFHAADQWRVVVGAAERLEVKNSSPHVLVSGDLNSTSDERLKKNIKPIDNALSDICQLEGVTFDWRDTGTQGQGFIAQQVEPIIPDVVNTDEDTGMKSINYVGLIGHLVEAIKSQQTQIDDLKAEIQSMKS